MGSRRGRRALAPCASRPRAAEAPGRRSRARVQRAPALAHQTCPGGGGMEPATAPRPDMAPELTPEEEQVSAAAAVGVSEPPRPRPACSPGCAPRPGPSALLLTLQACGLASLGRRPHPRPSLAHPGSRGTPGSELLLPRDFRGGPPCRSISMTIKVPRTGG